MSKPVYSDGPMAGSGELSNTCSQLLVPKQVLFPTRSRWRREDVPAAFQKPDRLGERTVSHGIAVFEEVTVAARRRTIAAELWWLYYQGATGWAIFLVI